MAERRIVCFGDSNTWGYDPENGTRYSENIRWTRLLEKKLGGDFRIVEEGQNGRTIANADPWEGGAKCGSDQIPALVESHMPMEALVIMLGTNDLKSKFHLTAADIGGGLLNMLRQLRSYQQYLLGCPELKILVIAPPAIHSSLRSSPFAAYYSAEEALKTSGELAEWYQFAASRTGCEFLDASREITAGEKDAIHLSPEGHEQLAELVYRKLRSML